MSPEGYTARTTPGPDNGGRRPWGSSLLTVVESKRTRTSNFGSSRRESHDATAFYDRFEPPTIRQDRDVNWHKAIDHIYLGDARHMTEVPSNSVALVVTSPPYFAGKEYEEDMGRGHVPASYRAYLQVLEEVFAECVRTLEPGGRMAVNVANLGRRPYRSLSGDVIRIFERLGLLLRGEVVWVKARGASGSTAWGTFQRPANPVLRDLSERVILASKGRFDRAVSARERAEQDRPHIADIWRDEFMEATTDIWEIPSESATRVNHPAPFPVELPRRLIELFTYRGDLILDPFIGSGTTAVAAVQTGRHYVGSEIDEEYRTRAVERVAAEGVDSSPGTRIPGERSEVDEQETSTERAIREGRALRDLAVEVLKDLGFVDLREKVKVGPGIEISIEAADRVGAKWLFDVSGGFTASKPGLTRTDTLWRAIGRAAVIDAHRDGRRLVLLTSHRPPERSPGARVLAEVIGADRPVFDVIQLLDPEDMARLAVHADG
jgi:DNA modification methylase